MTVYHERTAAFKETLIQLILSCSAIGFMIASVLAAFHGGASFGKVGLAASFGILATGTLTYAFTQRPVSLRKAVQDFFVIGAITASVRSTMEIWQAPASWGDLLGLTGLASSLTVIIYFVLIISSLAINQRREQSLAVAGVVIAPFLFNSLLLLQSPLILQRAGSALVFGLRASPEMFQALGRVVVLTGFNEAVAGLVSLFIAGRFIRAGRVHALLIASASWCGLSPVFANWGSLSDVALLPLIPRIASVLAATMASQAGLWGQVYLLTGVVLDGLHGRKPTWYWGVDHFRAGCVKGAVYSGIFMALVQTSAGLLQNAYVRMLAAEHSVAASLVLGMILFPLGKTIIESFDVSTPFFGRLFINYRLFTNWMRGAVIGTGLGLAVREGLLGFESLARFGCGCAIGAAAYAGVDLVKDMADRFLGRTRLALQTWRVYTFAAVLGGVIGGTVAWYFDGPQTSVVVEKFYRFAMISYKALGVEAPGYITHPLFNKWGAVAIGSVTGGVRLLYSDAVSGVVNWAFAAPLFSVNLVLLTALLHRSKAPLQALMSRAGFIGVIEQTVRVLRWGLWMAPVINSFLKISPEPAWYNQDGAIRSTIATMKWLTLTPEAFRTWSLQVFTTLLAFDWFRILIWFDHMGLRVATLVNMSFVAGDLVDEKSARALGCSASTRWIPEGIRRFATWAPLLIPFYIPRGQEWDRAWSEYEVLQRTLGPTILPPGVAWIGAVSCALAAAWLFMVVRTVRIRRRAQPERCPMPDSGTRACAPGLREDRVSVLTNGVYTVTLHADGRGCSRVFRSVHKGEELELTRQPSDPLWMCGKFFYVRDRDVSKEDPDHVWSITYNPVRRVGADYMAARLSPTAMMITHTYNRIRSKAILSVDEQDPVELWRVQVQNLESRPRTLELTSFRELVMNAHGAFWRHTAFNHLHVATWFVRPLNAIIARNNLLKDGPQGSRRRSSGETTFHAVKETADGKVTLIGYEDYRPYFIGHETLRQPEGLYKNLRDPEDEGLLYSFSPAACLRLLIQLPPHGEAEALFVDGYARDEDQATCLITRFLGIPNPNGHTVKSSLARMRLFLGREANENQDQMRQPWPERALPEGVKAFAFSHDGTELHVGWDTPRPWGHIMANEGGYGIIAANHGHIFSFMGNAQQNGLTPFDFGSVLAQTPGQVLYLYNVDTGEVETPTYIPLQQKDARYRITFGQGTVTFRKVRGTVEMEYVMSVLPNHPAEVRLLTIRNRGPEAISYRVVPYCQMMLGEVPFDTREKVSAHVDKDLQALFFTNRDNDFYQGWAFVAISLTVDAFETVRKRFIGGPDRDLSLPFMVEHGVSDSSQSDDGYRIAGLVSTVTIPAGGEESVVLVMGQTNDLNQAEALIQSWRQVPAAREAMVTTRRWWSEKLSGLRVETSDPAFDNMVNDWLPYQVLVSHLWGRTGLCQRSGAYGFRDQLQDVLPLLFHDPGMCRSQILLHAAQQFPEGDVLQWWHQSWEGRTGLGLRGRASDPHLWLPYVVAHYVQATGDDAILDEVLPFLEPRPIPSGADGILFAQRQSRGSASLYEHCRRAISFSLRRVGPHGLPLIGTGDWNDGLNKIGSRGKGESVWLGFFLYDAISRFATLAEKRNENGLAACFAQKAEALKEALDRMWRNDHYIRATTDDGRELDVADALTASWPIISGAADFKKGAAAMAHGLRNLEKDGLVALCSPHFSEESEPYPGRIADYPPGVRENGGQYSHGASWIVDALIRLAVLAGKGGLPGESGQYWARAEEVWYKISPLLHLTPARISRYGLPPHQQPADIYFGPGYEGRGGWSWYTGAAARMLYVAYGLLGLEMEGGCLTVAEHAFDPKGTLQLRRVIYQGTVYEGTGQRVKSQESRAKSWGK